MKKTQTPDAKDAKKRFRKVRKENQIMLIFPLGVLMVFALPLRPLRQLFLFFYSTL